MSKIAVVGEFTTNPGDFDKFLEELKIHGAASREEPGCEQFDIFIPLKSENRIMIFEIYSDRSALDTHASTDRIKAYGQKTREWLAERKITLCELQDS